MSKRKLAYVVYLDEVNCVVEGLTKAHYRLVHEELKIYVENYRHTGKFQIGAWDGKESNFQKDGFTFIYMLPTIIPILSDLGYVIEEVDDRKSPLLPPKVKIDKYLLQEHGIVLRDWQVEALQEIVDKGKGIIDATTGSGKTIFCAALCKIYGDDFRTLTIVPSEDLVKQTQETYCNVGLETGANYGKITKKKENMSKQHVVSTWQSLPNQRNNLEEFNLIIFDEAHVIGDVMYDILANELGDAQIRVALTGTVPKTKWKRQCLNCRIGNDIIYSVKAHELQKVGEVSSVEINLVPVKHEINLPDNEWETEFRYLNKNKHRIKTLVEYIDTFKSNNVLILVQAELGKKLSKELGLDFIDKDVDSEIRKQYYQKFETCPNNKLIATFGTVGTGISIDDIDTLLLIDAGKSESRVLQGIGRGMRLDGKDDHLVVHDLYASLYRNNILTNEIEEYSFSTNSHLKHRKRMYKKEKYPFKQKGELNVYVE